MKETDNCEEKKVKKAVHTFLEQRERFRGKEYLYCIIGYHLAPVLEKQKPAAILSFYHRPRNLLDLWKKYRTDFPSSVRLKYLEIKTGLRRICVFFYNPQQLFQTLRQEDILHFLQDYGYTGNMTLNDCLIHLKERFNLKECPHEMGVFLGIPVEDVIGFITNKGKSYKSLGYWKVYHDPYKAQKIFTRFEKAKNRYLNILKDGILPGDYLKDYSR